VNRLVAKTLDALLEISVVGSFSSKGFTTRSRIFDWGELPRFDNRHIVITGATSGVGLAAVQQFAELGATVTVVARNEAKGREAIAGLPHNENVSLEIADMSDFRDVTRVAAALVERGAIDVLIHNAGAITATAQRSPQNFEVTVATQLLSPFLLTRKLEPSLTANGVGRVIFVASGGMYTQRLALSHLDSSVNYNGVTTYARVKRAQVELARYWANKVDPANYVVHALHPGWVDTPGLATALPGFYKTNQRRLRTPRQGADTMVWLSSTPKALTHPGTFWHDRAPRLRNKVPWTRTTAKERAALWDWCVAKTSDF
jgi:dehydrogenase/reductase SDR family member 12